MELRLLFFAPTQIIQKLCQILLIMTHKIRN